jgi:guanylate kinase
VTPHWFPNQPMSSMRKGKIIVFSAPSGAGKTTLLDCLRESNPNLVYSISATTRPPRPGERNGEHYFFMSREEFEERIARDEFAEWQKVHGHYYGTPRRFLDETTEGGRHVVMDIDVYGKKKLDRGYPDAVGVLILPPSFEELERRLRARKTEREETIRVRLANARDEVRFAREEGKYEFTIVNDELERARAELLRLVSDIIEA